MIAVATRRLSAVPYDYVWAGLTSDWRRLTHAGHLDVAGFSPGDAAAAATRDEETTIRGPRKQRRNQNELDEPDHETEGDGHG